MIIIIIIMAHIHIYTKINKTYNCGLGILETKSDKSSNKFLIMRMYSAFACSGSCPVPGHVILTCKLHISGKI